MRIWPRGKKSQLSFAMMVSSRQIKTCVLSNYVVCKSNFVRRTVDSRDRISVKNVASVKAGIETSTSAPRHHLLHRLWQLQVLQIRTSALRCAF